MVIINHIVHEPSVPRRGNTEMAPGKRREWNASCNRSVLIAKNTHAISWLMLFNNSDGKLWIWKGRWLLLTLYKNLITISKNQSSENFITTSSLGIWKARRMRRCRPFQYDELSSVQNQRMPHRVEDWWVCHRLLTTDAKLISVHKDNILQFKVSWEGINF